MTKARYPGLYVRPPFDKAIAAGLKTVETRGYPPPDKHLGKWVAILRPAMRGDPATAVCLVRLKGWHLYRNKEEWLADYVRHYVPESDTAYNWESTEEKYGWRFDALHVPHGVAIDIKKGGRVWATVEIQREFMDWVESYYSGISHCTVGFTQHYGDNEHGD